MGIVARGNGRNGDYYHNGFAHSPANRFTNLKI